MLYILFTPLFLILADLTWITFNTHKGIYSHLRADHKHYFSLATPFAPPITILFRSPDLPPKTILTCALLGWAAPLLYIILKIVVYRADCISSTTSTSSSTAIQNAAFDGFLLGAVVYAVFNGTSYLTFPAWRRWVFENHFPIPIAFFDTLWGCALYTATSALAQGLYLF
jgi:hypothetical protein